MLRLEEDIYAGIATSGGGGGSSTKYGASINNFLGDVDSNGVLQETSMVDDAIDLVFKGVKDIAQCALMGRFTFTTDGHYFNAESISFPDLEQITGSEAITKLCCDNPRLRSVSFPKLKIVTASNSNVFTNCSNLKAVSFPELEEVDEKSASLSMCFQKCGLESISFPKLKRLGSVSSHNGRGFSGGCSKCQSLTSASLPALESLGWFGLSEAFSSTALTSMTFPSLKKIHGLYSMASCFSWAKSLTSLSFPALVPHFYDYQNGGSIFNKMLQGVTGCVVHFPSNLQSVINSWPDVITGFDGTNTIILFDLPATE